MLLVADCPRCRARDMTFNALAKVLVGEQYGWKCHFEVFSVCRRCSRPTVFHVALSRIEYQEHVNRLNFWSTFEGTLNQIFDIEGHVSLKDEVGVAAPEHVPANIQSAFEEAARCLAVKCFNASSSMFRLCLDLATRPLLPPAVEGEPPNKRQRRDLGLRVAWLLENNRIPRDLTDLAACVREDANDGVHVGNLTADDAEDLKDFTILLLERLYTEPERIEIAARRRKTRRE